MMSNVSMGLRRLARSSFSYRPFNTRPHLPVSHSHSQRDSRRMMSAPAAAAAPAATPTAVDDDDDDVSLPPLRLVSVSVGAGASVQLLRLADAKSGVFSQAKKQCDLWEFCWGASALLGSVLAAVSVAANANANANAPAAERGSWNQAASVIELGGGLGLGSLVAAKTGLGAAVLVTDLVPDALRVVAKSAEANGPAVASKISTRKLDWNKLETDLPRTDVGEFDVVLGSDVLFMGWCAKPVARAVDRTLASSSSSSSSSLSSGVALIVDPFRLNDGAFLRSLSELGEFHATTWEFPPDMIRAAVDPLADGATGSVVRVARAKLLIITRNPTEQNARAAFVTRVVERLGLVKIPNASA